MVDVVGLKSANEQGGFSAGDALLRLAADRLRELAPDARLLVRLGGDELVAVFTGPAAAERAARSAAAALADGSSPRLRAGWTARLPGEPAAVLLDRLYANARHGLHPSPGG